MKSVDPGILPQSVCFSFMPSETAQQLFFYPTWCGHYFCTENYYIRRDFYPPLLLAYIRQGKFHVEYQGEHKCAQRGDILLMDCSQPHYYQAENGLEFLYLHFDGSNAHALAHSIIDTYGWLMRRDCNMAIGSQLYDMVQFHVHNGIESAFDTSMRIYRLFEQLYTQTRQEQTQNNPIDDAIQYIRAHVGEPLTLQGLSDMTCLSPCYFSHSFKRQTGFSPMEYVINTRIDRAKILLVRTSKTISEIACEVGYSTGSSLTNLFIKRVGISPKAFRNAHQSHLEPKIK